MTTSIPTPISGIVMRIIGIVLSLAMLSVSAWADDWTRKTVKVKENGLKLGRKYENGLIRDGAALDSGKTYLRKSFDGTFLELCEFDMAVSEQKKVVKQAKADTKTKPEIVKEVQSRLELYQARKPYRQKD